MTTPTQTTQTIKAAVSRSIEAAASPIDAAARPRTIDAAQHTSHGDPSGGAASKGWMVGIGSATAAGARPNGRKREAAALPVAVIGAGPVGLAAAAHLLAREQEVVVLEAGGAVGWGVRDWAHVRLFSPWKHLVDPVVARVLGAAGWTAPDPDALPTGGELVERMLDPLAALPQIAPRVWLGRRVVAVARRGLDKLKTPGRETAPFELVVHSSDGTEQRILARAVIDASGTWATPNPLGANGVPVPGEAELSEWIRYGIPDVLGRERARYAGRRTLVVGSGHSAMNMLLDLATLRARETAGKVVWAIRRADAHALYGSEQGDALAARARLVQRLREVVDSGVVRLVTGFRTARLDHSAVGMSVYADDGRAIGPVDEIVATTGFRPDLAMTRELRLGLDDALESPIALAPLIDPNVHSCGTVPPHGFEELSHPERDYYTVGMKSYGRAPTFLLLTGYEQVRSVVSALAGDLAAARQVGLVLPEPVAAAR